MATQDDFLSTRIERLEARRKLEEERQAARSKKAKLVRRALEKLMNDLDVVSVCVQYREGDDLLMTTIRPEMEPLEEVIISDGLKSDVVRRLPNAS